MVVDDLSIRMVGSDGSVKSVSSKLARSCCSHIGSCLKYDGKSVCGGSSGNWVGISKWFGMSQTVLVAWTGRQEDGRWLSAIVGVLEIVPPLI